MSSNHGFKAYRDTIAKVKGPCIPYLGIFLTDITFIEEGNPHLINGLINFNKRAHLYGVMSKIQNFQTTPFNFCYVHQIQSLLKDFQGRITTDEEMWRFSTLREPKNTVDSSQLE